MESQFDPAAFLEATLDTPSERRQPLPVENPEAPDHLYTAMVGEVKARTWESKKPDAKLTNGIAWDVPLEIQVPASLQASLGYNGATLTLTDGFIINLTAQGTIDNAPGANRRIRMYREACDLNKPGDKFSARLMQGKVVKVKLTHEIFDGAPVERIAGVLRP